MSTQTGGLHALTLALGMATPFFVALKSLLLAPESGGVERVDSVYKDAGNGGGSFWHAAVGGPGASTVGKNFNEPSSPVKLGTGLHQSGS